MKDATTISGKSVAAIAAFIIVIGVLLVVVTNASPQEPTTPPPATTPQEVLTIPEVDALKIEKLQLQLRLVQFELQRELDALRVKLGIEVKDAGLWRWDLPGRLVTKVVAVAKEE